jgi:long-chain acyl-CoA synthetase
VTKALGRDSISTLADIVRVHGTISADKPMLTFGSSTMTFGDMDRRSSQVAQALLAAGVGGGTRVGFIGKNAPEYFELVFGAAKIDAVTVAVSWRLSAPEVLAILRDAAASVVLVGPGLEATVEAIEHDLPADTTIVSLAEHPRWVRYEEWIAGQPATDPGMQSTPDGVAFQLYTSGTTGVPKGVMLTNANVFALFPGAARIWSFDEDMVSLGVMPIFHISGSGWIAAVMYFGGHTVLLPEVDLGAIVAAIAEHRVTHALFVPAVMQLLLGLPDIDEADFSSLRLILYGASPISPSVLVRALEVFGCDFIQAYGMTETTGGVTQLSPAEHDPKRPDLLLSCGRPMPGVELRVVDTVTGEAVGDDVVGEVWIRSPQNMVGYWGRPDETAATITPDGWIRSGDAGYLRDGYLYLHDRMKDMIVSGGENIYPAEVEGALQGHPDIADVAVIGVPDDRWGETVKALVVPKAGVSIDPPGVIAFARERIAHFKCPTSVDVVDALPRNASGKLMKRELREPYWQGHDRRIGGGSTAP